MNEYEVNGVVTAVHKGVTINDLEMKLQIE